MVLVVFTSSLPLMFLPSPLLFLQGISTNENTPNVANTCSSHTFANQVSSISV